jgi:hypothetical protein
MRLIRFSLPFLYIVIFNHPSVAQGTYQIPHSTENSKPIIDSAAITDWADLLWSEPVINTNGKYFMYPIDNLPVGRSTLVIKETKGPWKKEIIGADRGFFSGNGQKAIFQKADSLFIVQPGSENAKVISNLMMYRRPTGDNVKWIAYQIKGVPNEVILHNLFTGKEQRFGNVAEYQFDRNGKAFLLKTRINDGSEIAEELRWIDLVNIKDWNVWKRKIERDQPIRTFGYQFDEKAQQLVFVTDSKINEETTNTIWYYREGMDSAVMKVANISDGTDKGMILANEAP